MKTVLTSCVELGVSTFTVTRRSHSVPADSTTRLIPHFYHGAIAPSGPRPPRWQGFTITLRHTTLGKTPLDQWLSRRRDLLPYNTQHSQQTSMPPAGLAPTVPASERSQTHAIDRATAGFGIPLFKMPKFILLLLICYVYTAIMTYTRHAESPLYFLCCKIEQVFLSSVYILMYPLSHFLYSI
jgi:hypothetical protein